MLPNLKAQSKWGWLVAGYLFLAGLGGGAYVTGALAGFLGTPEWAGIAKIGVSLGLPCVALGCLFLLADLGSWKNFWRAAMRPNSSWIARGTIIITLFMIIGAIHIALGVCTDRFANDTGLRHIVSALGIFFGFGTMIYTGILLAAARPIAFWSTAMLPLLFLVSALSTGIMAVVMVASLVGTEHVESIHCLARIDMAIIILEMFVLGFYLQGSHRVPESRASARLVLIGAIAPMFWFGVVLLGLAVPLTLDLVGVFSLSGGAAVSATLIASICGILGGLLLRQVILSAGIHAPLKVGRFEIALPIV